MDKTLSTFLWDTCSNCFELMREPLANYELFTQELSRMVKVKEGENEQFSFDVELDERIKQSLIDHGISGNVFSEESGNYEVPGEKRYRVVYDPFCNSSLASRTFREGAMGISIFGYDDYTFLAAAILDFQSGIVAISEPGKTQFYQIQTKQPLQLGASSVAALGDAWVVLTLENVDERAHLAEADKIMHTAKRVVSSSGHIYWLKLAAGFIDGYADPFGGEELYEMFACTVAQNAGCTVTDKTGKPFDVSEHVRIFERERHFRFYPVAAGNKQLHQELLASLSQTS